MRQTGYYFVDDIGRVAYYNGVHWTMCGTQDRYLGNSFEPISPTPITPEKMAAIDEIVSYLNQPQPPMDLSGAIILVKINDILIKHKLI